MRDLIPMECLKLLYKMVFGLNSNEFNTFKGWALPKARPKYLSNLFKILNLLNSLNLGSGFRPDPTLNEFNIFNNGLVALGCG